MADVEVTKEKKPKTEVTLVKMEDGREVGFAGARKMNKDYLIDESKIQIDGDSMIVSEGAVTALIDFRNGKTVRHPLGLGLFAQFAGHGSIQKLGDEASSEKDVDDAYLAVSDLADRLAQGEWGMAREAGGFSGASVVIQALMEASGKTQEEIKAFLQGKLDAAASRGEKLTRQALYASFRSPGTKVGTIVKRLEDEKAAKQAAASGIDPDKSLEELQAA